MGGALSLKPSYSPPVFLIHAPLADHQEIYCTIKIRGETSNKQKQVSFWYLKKYVVSIKGEALHEKVFTNCKQFTDIARCDLF